MVHAPLLLVTGYLYGTLLSSTTPLNISMVHYPLLLAHWLSLCYTPIFYRPPGYLCGKLPSLISPLFIPMIHCYLLLATGYLHGTLSFPIGPLVIPMLHCYLLLDLWIFLWYTPFFQLAHCLSLCYTAIFCWPTGYLYGTLPSPIGPLAISMVHVPFLLGHWISLWYTSIFYCPTGYPYGTLPSSISQLAILLIHYKFTGPLDISMVHYPLLLTHWISLWYIIIF